MTLTSRPYGGKSDLEAIAHLLNICEAIDPPEEWPPLSEVRMQFESPPGSVDRERDLRLWEDTTTGQLCACAGLAAVIHNPYKNVEKVLK